MKDLEEREDDKSRMPRAHGITTLLISWTLSVVQRSCSEYAHYAGKILIPARTNIYSWSNTFGQHFLILLNILCRGPSQFSTFSQVYKTYAF